MRTTTGLLDKDDQAKEGGHLEVVLKNSKLRTGNTGKYAQQEQYFILLQLDEQSAMLKPQKYRTDIAMIMPKSEEIKFQKSVFKFTECNPFELATIRIACFRVNNPAVLSKINEEGQIKR